MGSSSLDINVGLANRTNTWNSGLFNAADSIEQACRVVKFSIFSLSEGWQFVSWKNIVRSGKGCTSESNTSSRAIKCSESYSILSR